MKPLRKQKNGGTMEEKKSKSEKVSDSKVLKEASQEVESWPKWMQKNADLLFEEEQENTKKGEASQLYIKISK